MEDRLAFPVAKRCDVVGTLERLGSVAEGVVDLVSCPDVKLALLAFAISIKRGSESAAVGNHFA